MLFCKIWCGGRS